MQQNIFAGIAALLSFGAVAAPSVFWHSGDVRKGEHVLLGGGGWSGSPVVEVNGRRVTPSLVTPTAIVFPYKNDGVTARCRVLDGGKASAFFTVNAPDVWFMHGDDSDRSTPGGELRLYGRHLAPGIDIRLGGVTLDSAADGYRVAAKIPAGTKPGEYEVTAGGVKAGVWTVAARRKIWKDARFDITRYGAVPNHGDDCTKAVRAALAAAAKNGGGTVFVPCGRFLVAGTLDIPPKVLLRGESMEKSCLYWEDTLTPPHAFIRGTCSFGIHELMIHSGKFKNGIVVTNSVCPTGEAPNFGCTAEYPSKDISLKRVHMRFIVDQHEGARCVAERSHGQLIHGRAITAYGVERFTMEDCSVYAYKRDFVRTWGYGSKHVIRGRGVRIARCDFDQCTWGTFSGRDIEISDCTFRGSNVGISPDVKGLYFGHNRMSSRWENDREALTHDLHCNAFNDEVPGRVRGTSAELTFYGMTAEEALKKKRVKIDGTPAQWTGRELIVSAGTGVGQKRTIVKMDGFSRLTLDRPFDVPPDATSRFSIGALRDRILYVDNKIEDAAVAIQLYGGVCKGVVARNVSTRAGGFLATGGFYSTTPVWFVDMNDNVIDAGMSYWYPSRTSVLPHCSRIGTDSWYKPDAKRTRLTRGMSLKRNRLYSNAMIDVLATDVLIERNGIADSEFGIVCKGAPKSQFLSGNVFRRVKTEYADFSNGVPARERAASAQDAEVKMKPPSEFVRLWSYAFTDSFGAPPPYRDWASKILDDGLFRRNGYPLIDMEKLKNEGWGKAAGIILETFLDVKKPVRLSFSRWDIGAELYLDNTLILSRDAMPTPTIVRNIKPGVHRLRLYRAKYNEITGSAPVDVGLGVRIHNIGGVPEDAYVISPRRPGR